MVRILRREQRQAPAVETNAVEMGLIRIVPSLAARGQKTNPPILFIHVLDLAHYPSAVRNLVLKLPIFAIEIKVVPAIALRRQQKFSRCIVKTVELLAGIDVLLRRISHQHFLIAGCRIDYSNFLSLESPFIVVVEDGFAVGRPFKPRAILERKLQRRRLHINTLLLLNVKNDRLRLCQYLARQRIDNRVDLWPELIVRNVLQAGKAPRVSRIDAVGDELRRVGRPEHGRRLLHILRSLLDEETKRGKRSGVVVAT